MSAFPSLRTLPTAAMVLVNPSRPAMSASKAARETKVSELFASDPPKAPNIGRPYTGCGVGIDAFGSPIIAAAIVPPLRIRLGLTPKNAGFHSTRSAHFPTAIEPTSCAMPWVNAGLIVYFAT